MKAIEEGQGHRVKRQAASCQLDLVFVVDSSGSINWADPDNWSTMLSFMADIVGRLNIGPSGAQVGVVLFSDNAQNSFYLNTYQNGQAVRSAILGLPYLDGQTNTQAGLQMMLRDQFTSARGDRPSASNVAVIITDGESTINVANTIPAADQARRAGVTIFSIGIGDQINENELRLMSSSPQTKDQNYFLSPSFNALSSISSLIATSACDVAAPSCGNEVDLLIVVDTSFNVQNSQVTFPEQLSYVKNFVSYVDLNRVRVSVVSYSNFARVVFRLNTYGPGQVSSMQAAIDSITYSGQGSNIADAFAVARSQVFTSQNGDRANAPNVVLFLTFGPATTNTANTEVNANALKSSGVVIVPVGVTSRVDSGQLQRIASDARNVFLVNSLSEANSQRNAIVAAACPAAPAPTPPPVVSDNFYCRWYADALGLEKDGVQCFCRYGTCDNRPTNGTQCENINECNINNGGCEQNCRDTDGSYQCSCGTGFRLSTDRHQCEDINECLTPRACGSESAVKCINTYGSYSCVTGVQPGFAGLIGAAPGANVVSAVGTSSATTTGVIAAIAISAVNLIVIVGIVLKYFKNKRAASAEKPSSVEVDGHTNHAFTNSAGTARSLGSLPAKLGPASMDADTDSISSMTMDDEFAH